MTIAKQAQIRTNIKQYFDMAYEGEAVIVPRKQGKNVVIISENEYNRLNQAVRVAAYATAVSETKEHKPESAKHHAEENNKTHNLEKLKTIRSFKKNWNGNNAPSFPKRLMDKAENLINGLTIQPEIFPTALCTIQLEYDNARRDHMEIEIGLSDTAEIFIVKYNGEEIYETIPADADAINAKAGDFYE